MLEGPGWRRGQGWGQAQGTGVFSVALQTQFSSFFLIPQVLHTLALCVVIKFCLKNQRVSSIDGREGIGGWGGFGITDLLCLGLCL